MIRIENLSMQYQSDGKAVHAVREVTLQVGKGQFYTLLGPSGCGKTSMLRSIAGLERPQGGRILIDGVTVVDAEAGIFVEPNQRNIGMVFQSYAIWPHMSVFDNVAFPLRHLRARPAKAEIKQRVSTALQLVKLGGLEERPAPYLSGGQQQRLALARALVFEPRVLLLDEPLSNLDAKLREEMRLELRELVHRLGITTLFVTHEQVEALTMSDVVAVMREGRIEQEGSPAAIYRDPQAPFVADFIGKSNFLSGTVLALAREGELTMARVASSIGEFTCRATAALSIGGSVLVAVRPENLSINSSGAGNESGRIYGLVQSVVYLGNLVEVVLQVGDQRLRVQHHPSDLPSPGEQMEITFAPGSLHALPTDT
ncbi:MAG: ABC transporter ATP-binding protein [Burkholderiales bacterium]